LNPSSFVFIGSSVGLATRWASSMIMHLATYSRVAAVSARSNTNGE
jgi:hypothetical protein